jgi:DNA-binding MarR family transcriptional regulator
MRAWRVPEEDHVDRIVRAWAREDPDLEVEPMATIGRVLRVASYLERDVALELDRFELSINEFNALCALRRVGEPHALSPAELSRALLISSGGLTRVVERLEARKLVARTPNESDGRAVVVRLTDEGRSLQEAAMRAHLVNEDALLEPISENDRHALADILRTLLIAFESSVGRIRPVKRPNWGESTNGEPPVPPRRRARPAKQ